MLLISTEIDERIPTKALHQKCTYFENLFSAVQI